MRQQSPSERDTLVSEVERNAAVVAPDRQQSPSERDTLVSEVERNAAVVAPDRQSSLRIDHMPAVPVPHFNAVPLLTIYLGLVCFIPGQWVFPGLGAAGRPASLFGMGLFALWVCIQMLPNVKTGRTVLRWILLLNGLAILMSYALAFDRGLSEPEALGADRALLNLISTTGVILMASEGIPRAAHALQLTRRMTYFAAGVALVGILQFTTGFDPYSVIRFPGLTLNSDIAGLGTRGSGFIRVKGSTLHPIEFAALMALTLPLAVHHALHEPNRFLRRRRLALALMIAGAAMLAVSRSAVVGLAVGVAVLVWAWSPRVRLNAAAVSVVFLVGLRGVVPGLLGTLRNLFQNVGNDSSVTGRTEDYEAVAIYIADRPWFGRGDGTFIPSLYRTLDNAYLGRIVKTGLVGLTVLIVLLLAGLLMARHCARRHRSNAVRHLGVSIMAVIAVGIVSAGTFDLLSFPTSSGYLALALGLAARLSQVDGEDTMPLAPRGLLRLGYRAEYRRPPWWHRFDPELRNH